MHENRPMEPETVYVQTTTVGCDGNGPLGHPRVYLKIDDRGEIVCPYCSRRFVLEKGAEPAPEH